MISGKELREFRMSQKMTQKEFADLLGYSSHTIVQKWEASDSPVPNLVSRVVILLSVMNDDEKDKFIKKLKG